MAKKDNSKESNKESVIESLVSSINAQFGKGSIIRLNEKSGSVDSISTGSIKIDAITGVGGVPKGRVVEIIGDPSNGKTTLALNIIANAQKEGGKCLIIDAEHALDRKWAKTLGVDENELWISQPSNAEEAFNVAQNAIRSGEFAVVVIDSVSALVPKAELEGEIGDSTVGIQARLMSKALRTLVGDIANTNTIMIFINQYREKISTFGYGDNKTTSGGNALKFYASMRIELKKIKTEEKSSTIRVKIIKNKVSAPFGVCDVSLVYGVGFSLADEIIDFGIDEGLIVKSGTWFSYGDAKLGQGRDKVKEYLAANPEIFDRLMELAKASSVKEAGQSTVAEGESI